MAELVLVEEKSSNESCLLNRTEEYNYNELNAMRESIEKMNKFNQIEVLKLLHNHKDVVINENKYGVHINLTQVKPHIIEEIESFINYVNTQETYLNDVEKQKETYKNTYFNKDNTN